MGTAEVVYSPGQGLAWAMGPFAYVVCFICGKWPKTSTLHHTELLAESEKFCSKSLNLGHPVSAQGHRGGGLFNVCSHTCLCSLGVGFTHDCFFFQTRHKMLTYCN